MEVCNKKYFMQYLNGLKYLGCGSQGVCYLDIKSNKVIKIFHGYFDDEYDSVSEYDVMKFSDVVNSTFMWPVDVVKYKNHIIGYVINYSKKKNLYKINPLGVDLNKFSSAINKTFVDINLLTERNIKIYDIMYNILYSSGQFKVIDTLEYGNYDISFDENRRGFDLEIMYFLVDSYFDDFVNKDILLKEMYLSKEVDCLEFLKRFRYKLSEFIEKDIVYLRDAKGLVKSNKNPRYVREL